MAPILEVKNLTHTYSAGTPFEHKAIDDMMHQQIVPSDDVDKDQIIDQFQIFDFLFFFRFDVFHQRYSPDRHIFQSKFYHIIFPMNFERTI